MNYFAKLFGNSFARSVNDEIKTVGKDLSPLYQTIVKPLMQPIVNAELAKVTSDASSKIVTMTNATVNSLGVDNQISGLVNALGVESLNVVNGIKLKL